MARKICNFHSKNRSSSLKILIAGASGFIGHKFDYNYNKLYVR